MIWAWDIQVFCHYMFWKFANNFMSLVLTAQTRLISIVSQPIVLFSFCCCCCIVTVCIFTYDITFLKKAEPPDLFRFLYQISIMVKFSKMLKIINTLTLTLIHPELTLLPPFHPHPSGHTHIIHPPHGN